MSRTKGALNKTPSFKKQMEDPSEQLLAKGFYINGVIAHLRNWFTVNPYPIEYRKIVYSYGAGARKYGGIAQILSELEAEGIIEISTIETHRGLIRTLFMPEIKKGNAL